MTAPGFVEFGDAIARVDVERETIAKSYYHVTGIRRGGKPFPGRVTVDAASRFACLSCKLIDCRHIHVVRRYLATLPLEPIPGPGHGDQ